MSEWLTSREAAKYLKIPVASLRNMVNQKQIKYYKLGRRLRFKVEDLDNAMKPSKGEE